MTDETIILVDFGASRVKSAIWCVEGIVATEECAAPRMTCGRSGEVEGRPEDYWDCLEATAGQLLKQYPKAGKIWICTEMHGVLLLDPATKQPVSNYISWRDERASCPGVSGCSTLDQLNPYAAAFAYHTGMRLRSGLPFVTLAHLKLHCNIPSKVCCATLVDWLLYRGGASRTGIHASLAAGTGLYDIHDQEWSNSLMALAGLDSSCLDLPQVVDSGHCLGTIQLRGQSLDVYGGLGDLQAAAWGAGLGSVGDLLINLGTGSQVLAALEVNDEQVEHRIAANGAVLSAITHIPSGRALNIFAGFIDDIAIQAGGLPVFWSRFSSQSVDTILQSSISVNLAAFKAAWGYQAGGGITGIHENGFNLDGFLAAVTKSWLQQYVDVMDHLDPGHRCARVLVAGGLSRRGSFLLRALEAMSGRHLTLVMPSTGEDTLDGLLRLALAP